MSDNPSFDQIFRSPTLFLAFGFGAGLIKFAPGTFGTIVAIPLWCLMSDVTPLHYVTFIYVSTVVGVFVCDRASRELGVHDHGGIVFDEFVGFWIAMSLVSPSLQALIIGFALFRCLDILKPWPISWFDKNISGGFGIMLDDIVAGILTAILMDTISSWGLI